MRWKSKQILAPSCFVLLSLLIGSSALSEPKQELPRAYGPLVLGMSVDAFQAITGARPRHCVECPEGELEAALFSSREEAKGYGGTYFVSSIARLKYLPQDTIPPIINCYFYDGKLYVIQMYRVRVNSQDAITRYQTALGLPDRHEEVSGGWQSLYWESSDTRLRLTCSKIRGRSPFVQIDYYDRNILDKVPYRPEIK